MAKKRVLIIATECGSWAEELQAPWDACKKAGFEVTLATKNGKKPLPFQISVDPDFVDGVQNVKTNPDWVCKRSKELVDGDEWHIPRSSPSATWPTTTVSPSLAVLAQ